MINVQVRNTFRLRWKLLISVRGRDFLSGSAKGISYESISYVRWNFRMNFTTHEWEIQNYELAS